MKAIRITVNLLALCLLSVPAFASPCQDEISKYFEPVLADPATHNIKQSEIYSTNDGHQRIVLEFKGSNENHIVIVAEFDGETCLLRDESRGSIQEDLDYSGPCAEDVKELLEQIKNSPEFPIINLKVGASEPGPTDNPRFVGSFYHTENEEDMAGFLEVDKDACSSLVAGDFVAVTTP